MPKSDISNSNAGEDVAEKRRDGDDQNLDDEPIMFYWVIASHKFMIKMAYLGALAGRVAIGNA